MFNTEQLLVAVGSFLGSVIFTAWLRRYIIHRRVLDMPNVRSSHIVPTPRGVGLAFVMVFCAAALILFYLERGISSVEFNVIFFGGLVIAVIGWLDDHWSLRILPRIISHFCVALVCLLYLEVPEIPLPGKTLSLGLIAYPLMAILLTWCLNFFNFMDGIDGIAAVQTVTMLIAGLIILAFASPDRVLVSSGSAPYFLLLLMCTLGFLVWNWPPAKVFMGDTASGFLGFILGLFAVITAVEFKINVWSWLILFGVFITDSTVTLAVRFLRKESWYQAHRQHTYQRFAMNLQTAGSVLLAPERARAYAHRVVILAVAGINLAWLLPFSLLAFYQPDWGIVFAALALTPLIIIALRAQDLGGVRGDTW